MHASSPRYSFAVAALALLTIQTTGCATWHTVRTERPGEFITREKPQAVRVTLPESTLVLRLPSVRGDSILGVSRAESPPRMVAVPASRVRGIETQGAPTSTKIVLGTVGVAAVALAITAMIFAQPSLTNP